MAESQVLGKASTVVQELVNRGGDLPKEYIYEDGHDGPLDAVPLDEAPVIDVGLLKSSEEELENLKSALTSWGCFQAINHGMPGSFLDEVREVSKQFFALPATEKQKYSREGDHDLQGYGTDSRLSENQILDWTDRLFLVLSPPDQRKLKYWPEDPKSFRRVLDEYSSKIELVSEIILKAMARSLKLRDNSFIEKIGDRPNIIARFNYYPPCPRPDHVLGVKPHADGSAVTILLPDKEVEGLQFLKDNRWTRIPIIPEALLINVGDQVEMMSNGIFKSPVHRVVTNSRRERNTLAVFFSPQLDKEVGPVDELISETTPRLYKTIADYNAVYFEYYQQGKRPIEAVKL